MSPPIRTLLFSTLYPSVVRPLHGIFVETRLRELLKSGEVETRVIAPVPWFPSRARRFGEYATFAATPCRELHGDIEVHHPRYFLPPKVGMNIAPRTLAIGALPTARRMIEDGFDFDLIDAHYYYPDGVAASILARKLGKPFVVTARGSDLNLIARYPHPRRLILQTAANAHASIGVCKALMDRLAELGADPAKLHVLRNGVDLERFRPEEKALARRKLGLPDQTLLLSVGHLVELKGHHIAIEALTSLPTTVSLVIAGAGPERTALRDLAGRLGLSARVRFAGEVSHDELRWWYSAADALLLCSSREGWANVLLEAMACGTPVVATAVSGTQEVVRTAVAGRLVPERAAPSIADAVRKLLADLPERAQVRRYAEGFDWTETTQRQVELFRKITASARASR